jgi:hypothetical protein
VNYNTIKGDGMKKYTVLTGLAVFVSLISCATYPALMPPASATESGPRTLILDGETVTEEEVGGFISWWGNDFIHGGRILVEVGFFGGRKLEGKGFLLFDGGYTGIFTTYHRDGINHRWNWGTHKYDSSAYAYAFIIKPNNTGHYVDFSSVKPGTTIETTQLFKCYKR